MNRALIPPLTIFISGIFIYALLIGPFTGYMRNKPIEEKLGYVPSIKILKPMSADQKELAAASLVVKVLVYFGGIVGKTQGGKLITEAPDLQGMYRLLHGAVQLDPYNVDAYYFTQGFLVWDARQYKLANDLLDYGMKYRTWDWYLPFFAGFNSAYFLKDYPKAAEYYKRAGQLSGQELYISLAGRYMQASGQTSLAIAYLTAMAKGAERNPQLKKTFEIRLQAFKEVEKIELARDRFLKEQNRMPASLEELLSSGYLLSKPIDPYGGQFYLENDGKVSTSSKFAFVKGTKK